MCNRDELDACCSRKKGTPFIVKFLGLIGGFVLANIAGTAAVYVRNMKKMKENDCQYKAMHSVTMNKGVVSLSGDIQKAYLTCMTGIMDINFTEVPVNGDVYLDIVSFIGKVNVNLPIGVNVDFDGDGMCESLKNVVPEYYEEGPTVHIIRHNFATKLSVRAVQRG
ncbi:MAG: hypothetical protein MJ130_03180 [Lachnospiraceae bacterium]|nr:hypothetical protein [Lachnospiraceae bacterium]